MRIYVSKKFTRQGREDFVLKNEIDKLEKLGLSPGMVYHTSKIEGDGAGYDIASVNEKKKLFILKSRLLLKRNTILHFSK